jgi:hypothetical protein
VAQHLTRAGPPARDDLSRSQQGRFAAARTMITSGALAKTKIPVEPNIKIQKTGAGVVTIIEVPARF